MTTTRDGASPSGRQMRACSRWWLPAASIIGIQWICSRQGPSGLATGPAAGWARAPPTNAGAKIKLAVTIATNQRVTFIEDRSEPTRKAEGSLSIYALIAHTERPLRGREQRTDPSAANGCLRRVAAIRHRPGDGRVCAESGHLHELIGPRESTEGVIHCLIR